MRELAQAEAREIREIDAALKASRAVDQPSDSKNKSTKQKALQSVEALKALNQVEEVKALLFSGDFMSQSKAALLSLCRKNKIRRYSNLNKKGLAALLQDNGIKPPLPKPAKDRTQKVLAELIERLEKSVGL